MIPFGNETVTLIRRVENIVDGKTRVSYAMHTIGGCTWRRVSTQRMDVTQTDKGVQVVCRMPARFMPAIGDALVLGICDTVPANGRELNALIESARPNAIFVTSVSDNARPGMPIPHYAAKGDSV